MGHSHISVTMDTYMQTKAQTDSAFAALVEGMLPDLGNFWLIVKLTSRATTPRPLLPSAADGASALHVLWCTRQDSNLQPLDP